MNNTFKYFIVNEQEILGIDISRKYSRFLTDHNNPTHSISSEIEKGWKQVSFPFPILWGNDIELKVEEGILVITGLLLTTKYHYERMGTFHYRYPKFRVRMEKDSYGEVVLHEVSWSVPKIQ